jgi:hypothetical protein
MTSRVDKGLQEIELADVVGLVPQETFEVFRCALLATVIHNELLELFRACVFESSPQPLVGMLEGFPQSPEAYRSVR